MRAIKLITETPENGNLNITIPKELGRKVEIIILPVNEEGYETELIKLEDIFDASAYYAVIEDDENEDSIWRKYINANQA